MGARVAGGHPHGILVIAEGEGELPDPRDVEEGGAGAHGQHKPVILDHAPAPQLHLTTCTYASHEILESAMEVLPKYDRAPQLHLTTCQHAPNVACER